MPPGRAWVPAVIPLVSLLAIGCKGGDPLTTSGGAGTFGGAGTSGGAGASGAAGSAAGAAAGSGPAGTAGPMVDASADAVAATGCGKDISGTWDVIAQRPGGTSHKAVMVIGPQIFSLTVMNPQAMTPGRLEYTASGTKRVDFQNREPATIAVQNTPAALDSGSVPLALGGAWTFTGQRGSCTASVGVGLVSGHCTSALDGTTGGGNWPAAVPPLVYGVTYTATRTQTLASHFGDLGGVWTASPEGASRACTVRIEGNKITATCTTNRFAGISELTIGDDCVASGVNNQGYELSGRKR